MLRQCRRSSALGAGVGADSRRVVGAVFTLEFKKAAPSTLVSQLPGVKGVLPPPVAGWVQRIGERADALTQTAVWAAVKHLL